MSIHEGYKGCQSGELISVKHAFPENTSKRLVRTRSPVEHHNRRFDAGHNGNSHTQRLGIGPAAESDSLEWAGSQEIGNDQLTESNIEDIVDHKQAPDPVQDFERDSPIFDFSEWVDRDGAEDTAQFFPLGGDAPPGGMTSPSHGETLDACQHRVMPQTSNLRSLAPRNNQQLATPPVQFTGSQQTAQRTSAPVIPPICHLLTLDEEISRRIDKPYAPQLRCLFNYLGSTQSIITFKRALCDLRGRECGYNLVLEGARSDADHLRIVKRLRSNSAANSLLMIFHTVRLFQDDVDDLVCRRGSFVIQTQRVLVDQEGRLQETR